MTTSRFALPDVGEGLTEAEIVSWKVAPGDEVAVNQVVVEIGTARSVVELPSPFAGRVSELLVAEGDVVAVGTPIVSVASCSGDRRTSPPRTPSEGAHSADVLVREQVEDPSGEASVTDDVDPRAEGGREERIPVEGVRKAIAQAMVTSAFSAPHVSLFADVDATRTMACITRLKASPHFSTVKISPLLVVAKAVIRAVRRNPAVNSTWTDSEIVVHHHVNLGIAATTPRGLIVPNVKDAHALSMQSLAGALDQLVITARDGRTTPSDMANGTITITDLGSFGMDTGTPILNPGEVAVVALGAIRQKPWVVDGKVAARFVTTVGASFDHRVVDGDIASSFLADVAAAMEEPALLLLE